MKRRIVYNSPLWSHEGITKSSREYVKQIAKFNKVWLTQFPTNYFGPEFTKMYNAFSIKSDNHILFNYGWTDHWHRYLKHHITIGYSVYEGDNPPGCWINNMNLPTIKEVWVPSNYVKDVYKNAGVKNKLRVVPHGVGPHVKPIKVERKKTFKSIHGGDKLLDKFIFFGMGAVCAFGERDRKGVDIFLQAFEQEFKKETDVALMLKLNTNYATSIALDKGEPFDVNQWLGQYLTPKSKNVFVLIQDLSEEQLIRLYNSVDVGVFASRGEGFGMCEMEMMACDKPVITTGFGGTLDFSHPSLRIKVKEMLNAERDNVSDQRYPYVGSKWAEPDIKDLRRLMRKVYSNYKRAKKTAQAHGKHIRKDFSWDVIGKDIEKYIEDIWKKEKNL